MWDVTGYWATIRPFTCGQLVAETCTRCPRTALWRWVREGDAMRAFCDEHKEQEDCWRAHEQRRERAKP